MKQSKKKVSFFIIFTLIAWFIVSMPAYAGIYIEEEISSNIRGKEFSNIRKTYFTGKKALIVDPTLASKMIFDFESRKVYLVDDIKKNLSIFELQDFVLPVNEDLFSDFINLGEQDLIFKESGQQKKSGNYDCYEVVVLMPKVATISRVWISNNIQPSIVQLFPLMEKNSDILVKKMLPLLKERSAYIIELDTTIIRPDSPQRYYRIRLIKIAEQSIPDDLFALPRDYTRVKPE